MSFINAEYEISCGRAEQLNKSDLPEVAFSGRSNVGKSSLINKLVNRKSLARVSATPGKTATINFFKVGSFRLVDLPGYGYAKVSHTEKKRWAELVEGYFADDREFCLIVQIIDMRHPPTNDDRQMLEFLSAKKLPFIVVLTKKDKLNKTEAANRQKELTEDIFQYGALGIFPFSALNGSGKEEITEFIENIVLNYKKGD